jgi:Fe2+ or Zn2+ uptake regulation protein
MPGKRSLWRAQRAIVLQLLRDDHDPLWSRHELRQQLSDIGRRTFQTALELLEDDECIARIGQNDVRASICAQHLDELGLVGI